MEIELKHLAPYLPYELTGVFTFQGKKQPGIWRLCNLSSSGSIQVIRSTKTRVRSECSRPIYEFKPLLYPMSFLFKEIEVDGRKIIPINALKQLYGWDYLFSQLYGKKETFNIYALKYASLQKLFEWNFDVFNLIPEGLALNKLDYIK